VKNKLYASGMIDEEDVELIQLTDDIECVANDIEISLLNQIDTLKNVGLEDTAYYKSLLEFSKEKNIER
jgi:hypothetical protein